MNREELIEKLTSDNLYDRLDFLRENNADFTAITEYDCAFSDLLEYLEEEFEDFSTKELNNLYEYYINLIDYENWSASMKKDYEKFIKRGY